MIYILAGIAKSGKTTIAREFTKRYNIPYFSTDYIMMMLSRGNKELGVDPNSSDSSVARQIQPYVYGMIKTMVENKVDYLIEGVHFNPDFAKELITEYPNDIKLLYLGFRETSVILKIFELNKYKNKVENAWYSSFTDEEMVELVSYLIDESNRVYNLCVNNGLKYIDVFDLSSQIDGILKTFIKEE
jgi:2-phosphoglycerate kinase